MQNSNVSSWITQTVKRNILSEHEHEGTGARERRWAQKDAALDVVITFSPNGLLSCQPRKLSAGFLQPAYVQ